MATSSFARPPTVIMWLLFPGRSGPCTAAITVGHITALSTESPQAFDENVVDPAPFAVHADLDAGRLERIDPLPAGKLRPLLHSELWFATVS
jgi:hypothetical protein